MPNFSFLACLEVAEKFVLGVGGGGGLAVSTVSNLNSSCIELELELGFDNTVSKFRNQQGFDDNDDFLKYCKNNL